ncbi:DUF2827 domain-containing protein [Variovorax robiniae]|uniref:DUF2827 domain-containing protein n=1 Tax=Variovorax robiniae TaxID=1836199 RepID=A0ABU8X500_9BURK
MHIGISVISHTGQNIWENGMGQNVLFLAQLLQRLEFVDRVQLVDMGDQPNVAPQVDLNAMGLELVKPQAVTDTLDVIIELAGALPGEWLAHFRACGGKAVYMCVGQPHVGLAEPILFTDKATFVKAERMDEVWLLPKDAGFAPMLRTLHRCPVHEVPYIWSPQFLEQRVKEVEASGYRYGHEKGRAAWRVAIFEPNISTVKSCLIPMLGCDMAYRTAPDKIASMQVLNTLHMKDHPTMLFLANSLDIVRDGKAIFHGRHDFAGFMVQHADAVISHQWQNEQNYSYLDALHGDYPLIHNSPWLGDAGYYYPRFDAPAAGAQLLHALRDHDAQMEGYRARTRRVFDAVSPFAVENLVGYARRLLHLVGGDEGFKASATVAGAVA